MEILLEKSWNLGSEKKFTKKHPVFSKFNSGKCDKETS